MKQIHHAAACLAAVFLLSGLPVMPASAQECVPDIRLKIKVYLEGALTGAAALPGPPPPSTSVPKAGTKLQDCDECPEMIVVPAGSFCMGSPMGESGRDSDEDPVHTVTIRRPFAVGIHEVTFDEWNACVEDGGCGSNKNPSDSGWGKGDRPVIDVSWHDAKEYVAWLSDRTGEEYRLLTEAEWEYAARAGTTTAYSFGDTISTDQANYNAVFGRTTPVGTYEPNGFGLHDVHGNVAEWTEDCSHNSYDGAPRDGSAWLEAGGGICVQRVYRGGTFNTIPYGLRSASRDRSATGGRSGANGFRVARTL